MGSTRKQTMKSKTYKKLRDREYSKSYLEQKYARLEEPNNYPKTRLVLIKDFFRSKDLYKAIGFFLSSQIAIMLIAAGTNYPNIAGALNLLAILVGITTVSLAVWEINRRQRHDNTRRRVRFKRIFGILFVMLMAVIASTYIFNLIGISAPKQPNQVSLDELVSLFPVAMIFTMVVVSPVVEEIVFRELLPYATGPSYLSFVIASAIFVALHAPFGIVGWTNYGILATGFLYARLKDNNVYAGILTHIIWNALSILI